MLTLSGGKQVKPSWDQARDNKRVQGRCCTTTVPACKLEGAVWAETFERQKIEVIKVVPKKMLQPLVHLCRLLQSIRGDGSVTAQRAPVMFRTVPGEDREKKKGENVWREQN